MQSGKPVGVFRTHPDAPRVLIANSNLVAHWASWDKFHELDRIGLMMYGQMTAGSWIYIGSQGIIQGTYETFAEAGRQHYGGDLSGRWILTGGLGGMGGAQPLAATMAGASLLAVECRAARIERRLQTRYLDRMATDLDEALAIIEKACADRAAALGRPARQHRRGFSRIGPPRGAPGHRDRPDGGARPAERLSAGDAGRSSSGRGCRRAIRPWSSAPRRSRWRSRCAPCSSSIARGVPTLDYGNNIRQFAKETGVEDAFAFPGFVPAYIRPMFCRGKGPFRWAALSGDPEDIHRTDAKIKELFPDDAHLHHWLDMARERIAFQGLPARICWLGLGERAKAGLAFNAMVASGELKAPMVIGRDHLDSGSVASPNRETEAMRDGSDAIADWPLLNAMLNVASGASWVSIHHGGGVGIGFSQHAGMVIVCDGTAEAARRLERVLTNDPATGVMRHADAGYPDAIACAREHGLKLPMLGDSA